MVISSLVLTNRITTGLKALMLAPVTTWTKTWFADELNPRHQKPAYRGFIHLNFEVQSVRLSKRQD